MAKKPPKKPTKNTSKDISKLSKEDIEKLVEELQDGSESDAAGLIKHMRASGGPAKGIKSFFAEKNKKSAIKTGFGSTVKTISSMVFTDPVSDLLSAAFDKKYSKKEIDAMKGGDKKDTKDGKSGMSKQDMSKMKGDIIKNVANKIDKESGKIQDSIKDVRGDIKSLQDSYSSMYSDMKDQIESAKSENDDAVVASAAKIVKKIDSMGRTHYHDTATKKFTSKSKYEEQEKFQGGAAGAVGKSLLSLTKTVSNIQKEVSSIAKIASKIIDAVTQGNNNQGLDKDTAAKKMTTDSAKELGGMLLRPDPADAHFLSPEMSFLEADEQERITREALLQAFQDILQENPDAFKQDESMLDQIIDAAVGAALMGRFGKMFGGLIKGAKGIGGAIVGAGKKIFGRGAATATAAAAGDTVLKEGAETIGEKGLQTAGKETAETVASKGAQTAGKEVAEKGAETVAKKAGTEVAETAAKKGGAKVLGKAAGKTVLKSVLKKLPIIGAIAGLGFAAARAAKGDWTGAAMEAASGVASTLPGAGTAASVGIDAALAARDAGAIPGMGPPPETAADGAKPTPEKVKEATAQTLTPAVNKTTTNVTNQTVVNKQAAPATQTTTTTTKPSKTLDKSTGKPTTSPTQVAAKTTTPPTPISSSATGFNISDYVNTPEYQQAYKESMDSYNDPVVARQDAEESVRELVSEGKLKPASTTNITVNKTSTTVDNQTTVNKQAAPAQQNIPPTPLSANQQAAPEASTQAAAPTTQVLTPAAVNKTTTNVTNQTTVNKQAAPVTQDARAKYDEQRKATLKPGVSQVNTGQTKSVDAILVGGQPVIPGQPLSPQQVQLTELSMRMGNKPDPIVQQAYDLAKKQTASLAPAVPNNTGQTIIDANRNIDTMTTAAAVPPPPAAPPAPNQVSVVNNTMLPSDKKAGPKIDMEVSNSTMQRLARGDTDSPWAFANW